MHAFGQKKDRVPTRKLLIVPRTFHSDGEMMVRYLPEIPSDTLNGLELSGARYFLCSWQPSQMNSNVLDISRQVG